MSPCTFGASSAVIVRDCAHPGETVLPAPSSVIARPKSQSPMSHAPRRSPQPQSLASHAVLRSHNLSCHTPKVRSLAITRPTPFSAATLPYHTLFSTATLPYQTLLSTATLMSHAQSQVFSNHTSHAVLRSHSPLSHAVLHSHSHVTRQSRRPKDNQRHLFITFCRSLFPRATRTTP